MNKTIASDTAILVGVDFGGGTHQDSLLELQLLASSDKLEVIAIVTGKRSRPDSATYIGKGKVEEIVRVRQQSGAGLVIFNHDLSPAQQRNLSLRLNCNVIDRTNLILDIFARRAHSHEGKLQVELAQLEYLLTRLVRGWTHLERQKGGIGLRGPGETQLETDRRLIKKRVKLLKGKLSDLQCQRNVQRRSRQRANSLAVSIVGYTNAGKSTFFNKLTRAQSYAADQLFATLDTTTRKLFIEEGSTVVISDTVGFIRELPHTLVAAFRATLEETVQADLLLHVIDASSSNCDEQINEVNKILKEIGADVIPQILIFNKIDLIDQTICSTGCVRDEYGRISRIRLSAETGEGIEFVRQALAETILENSKKLNKESTEITNGFRDCASVQDFF
ncbi:GTPase HflX [Nitrosomonas ureae]|uniref:GTPase HflX n=1 Tax=Nitrosomonas ureae TaxID=44577 RepID=A0A286AGF2_9PROT|nr:GTPase HflX [Nitrosomonas ureae]SOD20988.1 GTP-binding protein HflX [Nitrosomonas ureae]